MKPRLRILVYKRTHNGDPDAGGCFGVHDCMGAVRHRDFDAVIGVGGTGDEAGAAGIAGKVNWIGLGPRKTATGKRGPNVRFEHFRDFGTDGPDFAEKAPKLARRMYSRNVRHIIDDFTAAQYAEARALLRLAANSPPSGGVRAASAKKRPSPCRPGCRRRTTRSR
jgi:hypothetical protein